MKAVLVEPQQRLVLSETPDPAPGPGQAVVEVEAIGVGYVDIMYLRDGATSVPGVEVVGRVESGQRVLALILSGGYAEQAVADPDQLYPVPQNLDSADAVALGVNALVAEGAVRRAAVVPGERVLVRGASGGIGVLATQIAHARGAEVTAVTSSAEYGERLRTLGAAKIVDRTRERPGETYDVIIDTAAGPQVREHLELLRPNGRYVLCGGTAGVPEMEAFAPLMANFHNSSTLFTFSLTSVPPEERRKSWDRVLKLVEDGQLSAVRDRTFPLAEAVAALQHVEHGKSFGKVVLLNG
ncbi:MULTISPECIES: quinone oxidoreductase family protein [Amycolatopsis]|uniref:Zinc-binding alcohol dehydrogenase family protein n=1 Tax=Amycolatopsis dendrobii TaxID=2760662 RepID=A0A7W3ZDD9_9PSEU|nr:MULTISPECIES: zinc-binding alcohol dehydrogenase family protein [Amycolatopsis]MBB1156838.1 zinc-binding alcohol dehydrogenase family protein [Amycolatopsis dendrobii]UKD53543.1 zinc-binding alcohol dehydrogenase family protein [Amycolatopsis sp. FU40]